MIFILEDSKRSVSTQKGENEQRSNMKKRLKENNMEKIFTELPPTKLFFRCAVPAVITSVFGALYSVVDGVFVGRYLGENALAAINLVMPVIMIVEAVANMIATGASVNMSMLLGEQKRENASKVFSFSVKFIILFSCVISFFGFFMTEDMVTLLASRATEEAIACSVEYLKIYAVFGPLVPIYFAMDNYLRVCGRQQLSMWIGVLSQLLNVVLDFVLIVIFRQGIAAAALASCISIVLGSVVMSVLFAGKRMSVYYTKENIPIKDFLGMIANGSSEFFSNIAASVMSVIMNLFLLKYGGTTAVAAFSVVMYVDSIIGMLNFGICDSLQPAISYCYGAGRIDRMKEIFHRVVIAMGTVAVISFLFMRLAGPGITGIFVKEGETQLMEMSMAAVRIFSFSYLVDWIDMCFSSCFTALNRPVRSLIVSLAGSLVFPVLFLILLTAMWGLNGVWLMAPVSAAASALLTLYLAKTLKWENNL